MALSIKTSKKTSGTHPKKTSCYNLHHPAALWNETEAEEEHPQEGGRGAEKAISKTPTRWEREKA
jgi:hypothetical protein